MFGNMLHGEEIWVALAFVLIVVLAWRPMQRRIGDMLDARADAIRAELDEAQRLKDEAQRLLAAYQRRQQDALKEAEEIVALGRAEAERAAEQGLRDLEASLQRRQRQAEEKVALEESKALTEVRNLAVDVAMGALRKILAEDLDPRRRNALIDQAIAALPQVLH